PVTAGTSFNFTVTALDAFGNTATGYTGKVHFSITDNREALPADYTFTTDAGGDNGSHTFSATFFHATTFGGPETFTATDTATSSIKGTSNGIQVNPGPVAKFNVGGPANPTAGVAATYTYLVTAEDQYNNVVPTYTGTVHLSSSDGQAALPADYTFTTGSGADDGTHTFSATLKTAGSQTITITDTATPQSTGTSGAVTVSPAAADHFAVAAPATALAGS